MVSENDGLGQLVPSILGAHSDIPISDKQTHRREARITRGARGCHVASSTSATSTELPTNRSRKAAAAGATRCSTHGRYVRHTIRCNPEEGMWCSCP
jgi:hypothetical protein